MTKRFYTVNEDGTNTCPKCGEYSEEGPRLIYHDGFAMDTGEIPASMSVLCPVCGYCRSERPQDAPADSMTS